MPAPRTRRKKMRSPYNFGFVRVAACAPNLAIADCATNRSRILKLAKRAEKEGVALLVTPELSLTGYTCGDLFHQKKLLGDAWKELIRLTKELKRCYRGIILVGLPLEVDQTLYNVAAVIAGGEIIGVVPKSYLPNYKEFYERRWFSSGFSATATKVTRDNLDIPFGPHLVFSHSEIKDFSFGVEICEDLWMPVPPSSLLSLAGARLICNLSASNEVVGKAEYRRQLVLSQSGRCLAGYVFAGSGMAESTTDLVFGGHCLIAENGTLVRESAPFAHEEPLIIADVDVEKLSSERLRTGTFTDSLEHTNHINAAGQARRTIEFFTRLRPIEHLEPRPDANPFFPRSASRGNRAASIFATQVKGLKQRLGSAKINKVAIGISGGLDSTLALLVCCHAFDELGLPRSQIRAVTMPGFGTTRETLAQARALLELTGVQIREVDIRDLALQEMKSLDHKPFGMNINKLSLRDFDKKLRKKASARMRDLVFENVQARVRTNLLMNTAFVVGTGDLSEIALGWSTYNADHMSMYNPNAGIPKTAVKELLTWYALSAPLKLARVLRLVVQTEISPELLPPSKGGRIVQKTEAIIGPYELHDFFLFHFIRFGHAPEKIIFLAQQTEFSRKYSRKDLEKWLQVFLERFFASQYKRSAVPDGPKVGSVALSPRGDWRMPSDVQARAWLKGKVR